MKVSPPAIAKLRLLLSRAVSRSVCVKWGRSVRGGGFYTTYNKLWLDRKSWTDINGMKHMSGKGFMIECLSVWGRGILIFGR